MFSQLAVLFRIAAVNILGSLLNVFVGLVLAFGAALLVLGGSLFSTLDESLSRSIVDSITGNAQVYGARSRDPLEIYGKIDGSDSNLAPLDDFKALKRRLLQVPNVEKVVPMGAATAQVLSGNAMDVALEQLRDLYRAQDDATRRQPPEQFRLQAEGLKARVRNLATGIKQDQARASELVTQAAIEPETRAALERASTDAFWAAFDQDPFGNLELLENRLAPLVEEGDVLFIRFLGTDLDAYQSTFSRMRIVEGGPVPSGHRGVLLPRFFLEESLKLKNARRLDKIKDALEAGRRLSDASDQELQRFVKENQAQTKELALQLAGPATKEVVAELQALLPSTGTDLQALLVEFFGVTDATFAARHAWFYRKLAPRLTLYRAKVGDTLSLRSFGRSGSAETALVKVYGVFELSGLEKSPLAGASSLTDLLTFRDLYGYATAEARAESEAMKAATQAREVTREGAEEALFGDAAQPTEQEVKAQAIAEAARPRRDRSEGRRRRSETFSLDEVDDGVVLNAALRLADGSTLAQAHTLAEVEKVLAEGKGSVEPKAVAAARALAASGRLPSGLAAKVTEAVDLEERRGKGEVVLSTQALLGLQGALKAERASLEPGDISIVEALVASARPRTWVVGWTSAAGFLGNFIDFFRLLLAAVVGAFAFIALIVVTIGMTIATLQRTATIGTMRAIGAQRGFVVAMVLTETVLLALVFGVLGAAVGAGLVLWLHARGIPAFRDELYFFFSGPVLRPELTASGLVLACVVTLVVSVLAVLFPTYLATRVAPVTAMQSEN